MSVPTPLTVRCVTDPQDPALAAFGRIQEEVYYAPDMLIPPAAFSRLLAGGQDERQDRILVAEQGSEVVGGTIYSLLPAAGFNSFMGVSRAAQGQGAGRALHAASLADVRAAGLPGMFADSVHPSRQSAAEREAEARSGSDPFTRRQQLHALGLRTVDVPYWQPVGGENGGPLKDLDLLYCPLDGGETVPLALVTRTMEAYWRGWLGPQRAAAEAQALAERAGNAERVRLLPGTETPGYWAR
ncbi:GNAT family N-acetyltransferase [Deinococcus radiodurans]|jgi:Acetyltransferase (GNAT) family.|nr:GNAT family N-acetyltransferase [Deinococcus radiodurans]ANC72378.1 acetyltransferase [Deinococcus radiodurans R1 = ATCC 13939 = DSM 20539]QIP28559.1 GNAT family N-acetyltransferase [Deinococcus radiodurans]QIP32728.1 GNAT family N-acetyltransferase [Deinococcus radiodurans]UID69372.1 acetyltransferase [Deinococcus radiodurans R1 = ATCC 13939 = DSM 20539]UTA49959.1 GNAT family N-acetyltransferase [Deinococcus radiodurans]